MAFVLSYSLPASLVFKPFDYLNLGHFCNHSINILSVKKTRIWKLRDSLTHEDGFSREILRISQRLFSVEIGLKGKLYLTKRILGSWFVFELYRFRRILPTIQLKLSTLRRLKLGCKRIVNGLIKIKLCRGD